MKNLNILLSRLLSAFYKQIKNNGAIYSVIICIFIIYRDIYIKIEYHDNINCFDRIWLYNIPTG
jgi:hypothetical protein